MEEVPQAASSSLGNLGRINENNSERDVHRLTKKFSLTLPIPLSQFKIGGEMIAYIKMSSWAKFLLSQNLWHHLAGLSAPNMQKCQHSWVTFWERFRQVRPDHEIYSRPGFDFSRCCCLLLHGDEGRSLRKKTILIMSAHSILGYGIRTSHQSNKREIHKLNYQKSTWATRFLLGVLPKCLYSMDDEASNGDLDDGESDAYEMLLKRIAEDMRELFDNGIVSPWDNCRYYFCTVNVMGDWPFIQRAGHLSRSFYNAAKHSSSSTALKGICHRCRADHPGFEWEDFSVVHQDGQLQSTLCRLSAAILAF